MLIVFLTGCNAEPLPGAEAPEVEAVEPVAAVEPVGLPPGVLAGLPDMGVCFPLDMPAFPDESCTAIGSTCTDTAECCPTPGCNVVRCVAGLCDIPPEQP